MGLVQLGKTGSCHRQPRFPTIEEKFQVKRRLECGWVQADLYLISIFVENIVRHAGAGGLGGGAAAPFPIFCSCMISRLSHSI